MVRLAATPACFHHPFNYTDCVNFQVGESAAASTIFPSFVLFLLSIRYQGRRLAVGEFEVRSGSGREELPIAVLHQYTVLDKADPSAHMGEV